MDPFTILSQLETCYKYGKALVDLFQRWKGADDELAERVVIVELCWMNVKVNMRIIRNMHRDRVLNDEVQEVLEEGLGRVTEKLRLAAAQVQKLQDPRSDARPGFLLFGRRAKAAKYALYKSKLDATIQDLETWQQRCTLAINLNVGRDPNPAIGQTLQKLGQDEAQEKQQTGSGAAPSGKEHWKPPITTATTTTTTTTTATTSPITLTLNIRDALQPTRSGTQPSVFLPNMPLSTSPIPFSRAKAARLQSSSPDNTKKERWFILDTLPCRPQTDVRALTEDVRDLAHKLKHADPFAFGLLNCKGVVRVFGQSGPRMELEGFDIVFNVPEGTDARGMRSLRGLLLLGKGEGGGGGGGAPSLSRRVRLALELATSVSYVHTFNFVHKNICPESVLLVEGGAGGGGMTVGVNRRSSFLIGFESFRSAGGVTSMMGDQDWQHNIYRHPERMGEFPAEEYRMQHDIYSLGVCLLELGLWEPLVEYLGGETDPTPEYGRVCREFVEMGKPWVLFKEYLVELAQNELPRRMGDRYADVVLTCLTCLDSDGSFGDQGEVADEHGILVGVRFIETILGQLNEIVL